MSKFHNRTRRAASIPQKLIKERKFYLLLVYYLLLTSYLAREGIHHSGSYRFADHIYQNKPKGTFLIGYLIDLVLLQLQSAQSLRARYLHAKKEIKLLLAERSGQKMGIDILAVPCGLAREFFEVTEELRNTKHPALHRITWHGIDLDQELVHRLQEESKRHQIKMKFEQGDALNPETYGDIMNYDMIISMGLTEFLEDREVIQFYKLIFNKLKHQGKFFTSGMLPHRFSDYLMRNLAELHTHYRSGNDLQNLARKAGFSSMIAYQDKLQNLLIAIK